MSACHSPTTDLGTLVDLASELQSSLLPSYRLLAQEDLEVVETRPIDAGGFADVWVSKVGDRKVALKSYRCHSSADYMPTYKVGHPSPLCVLCPLTANQQRFYHEVSAYIHLSHDCVVPFIGVYSTREHPLALVFEFMEHLNLGVYLTNNRDAEKLKLVRFPSSSETHAVVSLP